MLVDINLLCIMQCMDDKQAIPTFLQPFRNLIMEYILNIGLDKSARYGKRYQGKRWQYKQAVRKIAKYNLNPSITFVKGIGKQEDCLIIKIQSDNETKTFNKIHALSGSLKQDCIAVYDVTNPGNSILIGKHRTAWGKFNIGFFRFK